MSLLGLTASAQSVGEYRGFWVDAFNTPLNTHADIVRVVENARAAHTNALFVQVRRRGDAWYVQSLEPLPDDAPIERDFDPLADVIAEAHARNIEVHAFVSVGAIWNRATPPLDPNHVFNRHGVNPTTRRPDEGAANWLTRTLLPDGSATSVSGHRFGADFWIDPGHPDAAAYTVSVLAHLVSHYEIDGLHLDRIRYPEISVAGQTPSTGASIGYNEVSVARFNRHVGLPPGTVPAPNDVRWTQWRRDQVSNLVRRIYLIVVAIRPRLKVSAALIAFGSGPTTEAAWTSAEAFWRVYQDWRAWTDEGTLDLAIPMNYKSEVTSSGRAAFDQWNEWAKDHQFDRWTLIGQGAFLSPIEGSLRQVRRALAPSAAGTTARGVILFSMATSNAAATANPFSIPPGRSVPARPFADFASALVAGVSTDGAELYEDRATQLTPVFAATATPPEMPWKTQPRAGHLMGFVRDTQGRALDTAAVAISRIGSEQAPGPDRPAAEATTDGGGFYGAVDLAPGRYRLAVSAGSLGLFQASCTVEVAGGRVSRLDLRIDPRRPATADCTGDAGEGLPPPQAIRRPD